MNSIEHGRVIVSPAMAVMLIGLVSKYSGWGFIDSPPNDVSAVRENTNIMDSPQNDFSAEIANTNIMYSPPNGVSAERENTESCILHQIVSVLKVKTQISWILHK